MRTGATRKGTCPHCHTTTILEMIDSDWESRRFYRTEIIPCPVCARVVRMAGVTEYAAELEIAYRNGFNDGRAEGLGQVAPRDPPGSRS